MSPKKLITIFFLTGIIWNSAQGQQMVNDSAEIKAIEIAHEVIAAMGGECAFNETNYIGWTFFDRRKLVWDKVNNRIRIDYLTKPMTIIASLTGDDVKLFMNNVEVTQPDSLKKYGQKAKMVWANDSYWLLMPFKLLDEGVNLRYLGDSLIEDSNNSIIELTFDNVGFTPENKYLIYIDKTTHLVSRWSFYDKYNDPLPEFTNTWTEYKLYGNIFISGNRGTEGMLTDINVWDYIWEDVFKKL
ncbi:MAG: hypothetical protein ACHQFW_01540 [Chitinophagales bacterium]